MSKEVSKTIPVAKRIIEFGTKDVRRNDSIIHLSDKLISKKLWREFAEKALLIVDGWNIIQYAEEYPIVRYKCDEIASTYLEDGPRLNSFIESITVSSALYGKKADFGTGQLRCKDTDSDTVVYFTDNVGINHAIIQHDLYWFLLQKPNLVVSPEGVLVFFTDKEIIATVACNNGYHWINDYCLDMDGKTIKNIEVCDSYCKIIICDEEGTQSWFSLKFAFDATSCQLLNPEVSEM